MSLTHRYLGCPEAVGVDLGASVAYQGTALCLTCQSVVLLSSEGARLQLQRLRPWVEPAVCADFVCSKRPIGLDAEEAPATERAEMDVPCSSEQQVVSTNEYTVPTAQRLPDARKPSTHIHRLMKLDLSPNQQLVKVR